MLVADSSASVAGTPSCACKLKAARSWALGASWRWVGGIEWHAQHHRHCVELLITNERLSSAILTCCIVCHLVAPLCTVGKAQPASATPPAAAPAAAVAAVPSATPSMQSLLLLRGLLGAATVTAYYAAVEELPLPVAVALFFFHPVLALLLDSAVNDTHVPSRAASSCALTVLGVLVIGWHDQLMLHLEQAAVFFETLGSEGFAGAATAAAAAGQEVIMGPELSLYGVLMGLVAASANAAAFVVVGRIGREVPTLDVCWWQYCVTTHAAVAVLLLSQLESAVVHASATSQPFGSVALSGMQEVLLQVQQSLPSQHDALLLSGVVVANFLGQLLLNAGFQRIDAGRGAAINTLQVLFANLWDVVLLHSAPSAAMLAGSGMIAAGVVGTRQSTSGEPAALEEQQPLPLQTEAQAAQQQQQWQELLDAQQGQQQQQLQLPHEHQKQRTGSPAATAAASGSNGASQQQPLPQQEAASHVQQPSLVEPRRKL